jgi:hypothetical protein
LLRLQLRHEDIAAARLQIVSVAFSVFVSLGTVYLGLAITQNSAPFYITAIACFLLLYPFTLVTVRFFSTRRVNDALDRDINAELQQIRNRYALDAPAPNTPNPNSQTYRIGIHTVTKSNAKILRIPTRAPIYQGYYDNLPLTFSFVMLFSRLGLGLSRDASYSHQK